MEKLTGFLLLLAALNVARAQDKATPKYFKDGGGLSLELRPRPTEPITNVLWKHRGDLVAEWFKDKATGKVLVPLTYYGSFKGRSTMNVTTGRLDIINMAEADMGVYSVEVNSVGQNERYNAVMIKEVPEPEVVTRPLVCSSASDSCTPKYFKDGGVLTLDLNPRPTEPITNVVWKHQGNLVAEWFKNKETGFELVPLTYYGSFKGRTTMDVTTGRLDIINMTKADMGVYSVEVNSDNQNERYNAVMIKEVPEPEVVTRPLVCSSASDSCTLTCEADPAVLADAGPVTYSWKKGDGQWTESGKDLDITKEETAGVETFTCRIQNPVSARESKPKRNPHFEEKGPDPELWFRIFVVVTRSLEIVVIPGVVAYLLWRKRETIGRLMCSRRCRKGDEDAV